MKSVRKHLRAMLSLSLALCMMAGNISAMPYTAYAAEQDEATGEAEPAPAEQEHHFGDYEYNNDATCEEDGTETAVCTDEGCTEKDTRKAENTALGHEFKEEDYNWIWSSDHQSATLLMICSRDESHTRSIDATVTSKEVRSATCTSKGMIRYTATAVIEEEKEEPQTPGDSSQQTDTPKTVTVTDVITVYTNELGHAYEISSWNWSEDNTSAAASLVCSHDSTHTASMDADISYQTISMPTCTTSGQGVYTASITLNGLEEKDEKTVTLEATGHDYEIDSWDWAEDYSQATANVVCLNDSTHSIQLPATITTHEEQVTCTTDGSIVYTATVTLTSKTFIDEKREIIQPRLNHDYRLSDWTWSADNTAATANIVCQNDKEHNYTIDADVTSSTTATCTSSGVTTYTASVTHNGQKYTNQKSIETEALGHVYGDPTFIWKDTSSCTLSAVCERCGNATTANCRITSREVAENPETKEHSSTIYTASGYLLGKTYTDSKTVVNETHTKAAPVRVEAEGQGYDDVTYCSICQEELERHHVVFTVTFDPSSGSGEMDDLTVEYGVPTTIPVCAFTKTGNHDIGWYAQNKDGLVYAELEETRGWYSVEELETAAKDAYVFESETDICQLTDVADDVITLYPKWEANTVNIQFNKHGGTGTMANMSFRYGTKTTITANAFVRSGYTFTGWYSYRKSDKKFYAKNSAGKKGWYTADNIRENGYTKVLSKDETVVSKLSSVNGDTIVLYAQWKANTYSIAFDKNGGTSGSMKTIKKVTYDQLKALTANGFKKSGYKFKGWYAHRDSDNKWLAYNPENKKTGWCSKKTIKSKGYIYVTFEDMVNVKNLTTVQGDVITMYAQWGR